MDSLDVTSFLTFFYSPEAEGDIEEEHVVHLGREERRMAWNGSGGCQELNPEMSPGPNERKCQ